MDSFKLAAARGGRFVGRKAGPSVDAHALREDLPRILLILPERFRLLRMLRDWQVLFRAFGSHVRCFTDGFWCQRV